MKYLAYALIAIFSLTVVAEDSPKHLTIERMFDSPKLEGSTPRGLKFSPDGKRLSFLSPKPEDFEVLDLWEYDLKSGTPRLLVDSKTLSAGTLSEQEKSRRERMRISQKGIVEYQWSFDGQSLVFPYGGKLNLYIPGQGLTPLTNGKVAEVDSQFSPKGHYISFVRGNNLYILDPKTKKEFAVSRDGRGAISYGLADFIAQEEMERFTGYWWSKDDRYLAFARVDESKVTLVDRYDIAADKVTVHQERYPQAGSQNATVTLGIVRVADVVRGKAAIRWIPLGAADFYLARVDWTEDGLLSYQIQSRDQKRLDLFLYNPENRQSHKIMSETDPHWINLNDDLRWLKNSANFLWASERSGFKHLYLMDRNGKVLKALTQGAWDVDSVQGVDEDSGSIYFSAALKSPLERHLYRVSLNTPSEPIPLTQREGWHDTEVSKDGKNFCRSFFFSGHPDTSFTLQNRWLTRGGFEWQRSC